MGKKIFIIVVLVLAMFFLDKFYFTTNKKIDNKTSVSSAPSTKVLSKTPLTKATTSIFVPYWANFNEPLLVESYDRVIYFGVSPTVEGINKEESGYRQLASFASGAGDKDKLLTIRMVNSDINMFILKNKSSWDKIMAESLEIAEDYKFNGIVLDLEINSMPFNDVVKDINGFVQDFYTQSKDKNLYFALTLYGDTFYRKRPYDISFLSKNSDEIMIMAYDLHKAGGEPGPNFPLNGKEKYGYTYESLINDFVNIPPQNLSVIFGMYGYDWIVDEKKRPIKPAKSLSLLEIQKKFINNCQWKNCVNTFDQLSSETEIGYVDEFSQYHIVWFEDENSVDEKKNFLQGKGINNFIYWAYGYF